LVYVYYNLRLWVKQLEIKIDVKPISLDEIDTTAAWRVEVEEPVTETIVLKTVEPKPKPAGLTGLMVDRFADR
jgi:hypothetical protein